MRKSLILALMATWATIGHAIAQYVPLPGNVPPQPGYVPGAAPSYPTPGSNWREQRLNEERRVQPRENYEKQSTPNNATGSGAIGLTNPNAVGGECAKGMSEETCRRRGQQYNPPR